MFTLAGLGWGVAADYYSRPRLLALAVSLFSLATVVQGLSWRYWQLVVGRMLLAAGDAACTPLAVSLITELYPANQRGARKTCTRITKHDRPTNPERDVEM